jgi:predicted PurR-regulated permease PerM
MMMKKRVALLPAATLIVQLFFANFLGPVGLILALPLAVVCKTWIEEAWIVDVLEKGQKSAPISAELPPSTPPENLTIVEAADAVDQA